MYLEDYEVADDHHEDEEGHADEGADVLEGAHAVPRALDVLAAEHAEYDHKRVEEVHEVPARHRFLVEPIT